MKTTTLRAQLLLALLFNVSAALHAQAPNKPNIVVIMVDDGRYDEYRPTGAPDWFVAPNIERIANEGVNFHQAYAPTPLCGPSRASVYTGRYAHQHGTFNNGDELDTTLPMIQKILHDEGYYTGFIGKYGNGFPAPKEFDYWVDIGDDEVYKNTWIKVNGENVYIPGHITDAFNTYINAFLDSVNVHNDQPFAFFFSPLAPHTPNAPRASDAALFNAEIMPFPDNFGAYSSLYPNFYYGPQSLWVKDSLATVKFIKDRYSCLIGVEDNVSRIMDRLDIWEQMDSTLILFTSDNGYLIGEHRMRAKAFGIQESTHVPMFLRYPEWFPTPDSVNNDFVELIDIPNTLLDAAGIPNTFGFEGYSLRDIAAPDTLRPYSFYTYEGAEPDAASQVPDLRGVRSLDYFYVYSSCDCWSEELYDLHADPEENNNRILQPEYYAIVHKYRNILDSLRLAYDDIYAFTTLSCNLVGSYEVPDGLDNDCDGVIDDTVDAFIQYADLDGDGYGDPASTMFVFGTFPGYVTNALDCADTLSSIHPAALEVCDGVDNDCDGLIDDADGDIIGQQIWYFDSDLDGFGDSATALTACFPPLGFILVGNDCDDTNPADTLAYPEICNMIDDDCDGMADDTDADITGQTTWYADMDHDGVGNYTSTILSCFMPPAYTDTYGDCNDADSSVTHGSPEVCNHLDDDCDGLIDDSDTDVAGRVWYFADNDGDGFGNQAAAALFCFGATGYVLDSTDCNDLHSAIFPLAAEICDGLDNNCNGLIDDADPLIIGQTLYYADADADGYGNPAVTLLSCALPAGYTLNALDCNDLNNAIHPSVTDICDGINNDCDFITDEDVITPLITAVGPVVFCTGGSVVLTASPIITGFTYQWFKSGVPVTGATNTSYTVTASGSYKIRFTAPAGCITESTTLPVTVNANPKPSITNSSVSNDLCLNSPVKLSTKNTVGSTYQWYKGALPITGGTSNKYNAISTGTYKVTQINAAGCSGTSKGFSVVQNCRDIAPYQDDVSNYCSVYPNPNEGDFTLEAEFGVDLSDQATIRVYSILGQLLFEQYSMAESGSVMADLQLAGHVPPGVYIIDVSLGQYRVQTEILID